MVLKWEAQDDVMGIESHGEPVCQFRPRKISFIGVAGSPSDPRFDFLVLELAEIYQGQRVDLDVVVDDDFFALSRTRE